MIRGGLALSQGKDEASRNAGRPAVETLRWLRLVAFILLGAGVSALGGEALELPTHWGWVFLLVMIPATLTVLFRRPALGRDPLGEALVWILIGSVVLVSISFFLAPFLLWILFLLGWPLVPIYLGLVLGYLIQQFQRSLPAPLQSRAWMDRERGR